MNIDWTTTFAAGRSYRDFLEQYGKPEQRERWQQVHDRIVLTAAQHELLGSFSRTMKVLCIAGAWCGDCVQQCPIFDHFAAVSSKIELRFVDRDAQSELSGALKICGGARVPTVVFLSEDDMFCGLYGDRTLAKYRSVVAQAIGASCPTGIALPEAGLLTAVVQDWLDEFERIQWMLRTSGRLRQLHGD